MQELVKKRLESFGYIVAEGDESIISLCVSKVSAYILNEINGSEIPDGLITFAVDMICGEVLSTKRTFSPESLSGIDLSAAVKQISAGDTTISFDTEQTVEKQLDSFIYLLQNCGKNQFACFRRLRW